MIIIPTRVCNTNKCSYCNVYKIDFDYKYFKSIDYDNFIENIIYLSKKFKDKNIRFFGGEPFIKLDLIKKIIKKLSSKNLGFNFTINTNLSLLNDKNIKFIKKYNIKLIISCNGNILSHMKTRGINLNETLILYQNLKKILENKIKYQINIVTTPEIVKNLYNDIKFMYEKIGLKIFNLLPVNYNGWEDDSIKIFKNELELIKNDITNDSLKIDFINKNINNKINLFNSEIVIDSDGNIYPSMVVLENFFLEFKNKILITNINKNISLLKNNFKYLDDTNFKIYENYINKIINNKFGGIIKNDNIISEIFGDFLKQI